MLFWAAAALATAGFVWSVFAIAPVVRNSSPAKRRTAVRQVGLATGVASLAIAVLVVAIAADSLGAWAVPIGVAIALLGVGTAVVAWRLARQIDDA